MLLQRKIALDHHGVDPGDSSDGNLPCPNRFPGKKLKYAWKGAEFESSSPDDEDADTEAPAFGLKTKPATASTNPPPATVTSCTLTHASGQSEVRLSGGNFRQGKLSLPKGKRDVSKSQP